MTRRLNVRLAIGAPYAAMCSKRVLLTDNRHVALRPFRIRLGVLLQRGFGRVLQRPAADAIADRPRSACAGRGAPTDPHLRPSD